MKRTPEELETEVLDFLNAAMAMQVSMSENDSDYDLNFIREKLAKVGVYQERLSDIQMALTKTAIEVIRTSRSFSTAMRFKEKQAKASEDYADLPLNEKGYWLEQQNQDLKEKAAAWAQLTAIISEVKGAVGERAATMRRLDSDLRLHSRIYEARVAAGATSPSSYKGSNTKEIEL